MTIQEMLRAEMYCRDFYLHTDEREMYAKGGITQQALADIFCVSNQHISDIVRGKYRCTM